MTVSHCERARQAYRARKAAGLPPWKVGLVDHRGHWLHLTEQDKFGRRKRGQPLGPAR